MKMLAVIIFSTGLLLCSALRFEQKSNTQRYANPDQYGYRFCASWKLADGTPIYSGCDPFVTNRCGKELDFDYRCCSGFEHSKEPLGGQSSNPCGKVVPHFKDCPSVIESLGFPKFASYLRKIPELVNKNAQPYTLFVPLTAHDDDLDIIYKEDNQAARYSVVKGRYYADDLKTWVELESLYNNQKIRISRSACGIVNIDCVELSRADIECGSGLLHIIRKPLIPRSSLSTSKKGTVMDLLRDDTETRDFAQSLPATMQRDLATVEDGRTYTVTAPTAKSWLKIRDHHSREQLEEIAASHVSVGYKCTSNIYKSEQQIMSTSGQSFSVQCNINARNEEVRSIIDACGKAHEFNSKYTDQVGANGVVHLLNGSLLPNSLITLNDFINRPECGKYQNIDKFMELLRECNLHTNDVDQYAVIAPLNSAFDWWREYKQFNEAYELFQRDPEYRCKVARYHIVKHNGELANITAFSGHTHGRRTNNVKEYLYETTYFVKNKMGSTLNWHYSPVSNLDTISLKKSSIYRTSRINVIPEKNITDILRSTEAFTHTNSITEIAEMEVKVFSKKAPTNLYLVTTDEGWVDPRSKQLGKTMLSAELARYKSVQRLAENFAKLNHVPLYLWGGDIGYFEKNSIHRIMSSAGVELIFWMDLQGVMRIGYDGLPKEQWPRVVKFNIHCRDGIIWVLDGIVRCPPKLCPAQLEDRDTYTFYTAACITSDLPGEGDVKNAFSDRPTEIAIRHPDKCVVIKQGEVTTVKDIFEEESMEGHDH